MPSLAQHVGETSTIFHGVGVTSYRRSASTFIGEEVNVFQLHQASTNDQTISFCCAVRNRGAHLEDFLNSLVNAEKTTPCEVVVADFASDDVDFNRLAEDYRKDFKITVVDVNGSFERSKGLNIAASHASGDILGRAGSINPRLFTKCPIRLGKDAQRIAGSNGSTGSRNSSRQWKTQPVQWQLDPPHRVAKGGAARRRHLPDLQFHRAECVGNRLRVEELPETNCRGN